MHEGGRRSGSDKARYLQDLAKQTAGTVGMGVEMGEEYLQHREKRFNLLSYVKEKSTC